MEQIEYRRDIKTGLWFFIFSIFFLPLSIALFSGLLWGISDYYMYQSFQISQSLFKASIVFCAVSLFYFLLWIFFFRKQREAYVSISDEGISLTTSKKLLIPWNQINQLFIQTKAKSEKIINIRVDPQKGKNLLFGGFDDMNQIAHHIINKIPNIPLIKIEIYPWYKIWGIYLIPAMLVIFSGILDNNYCDKMGMFFLTTSSFLFSYLFIKFNPYRSSLIVPRQIGWLFSAVFFVFGVLALILIFIDKFFI